MHDGTICLYLNFPFIFKFSPALIIKNFHLNFTPNRLLKIEKDLL